MRVGVAVFGLVALPALGCSSSPKPIAGPPKEAVAEVVATDNEACDRICTSSVACGDSQQVCKPKCNDWLVSRSRKGVARAVARCAIPRIDSTCAEHGSGSASEELVACIGEVGRKALGEDRSPLLIAGRAICNRDSRCAGGTAEDARACYSKLTSGSVHDGLLIFGAIKPALVERFAACMDESECQDDAGCFGQMLGEPGPAKI
jgi:hypothetical protein